MSGKMQCANCGGWFGVGFRWVLSSWYCDVCKAQGFGVIALGGALVLEVS
ncbi:hypothetical protein ACFYXD_38045 [Streptomyces platensis]